MSKILIGVLLCVTSLFSAVNDSFSSEKNYRILKELDINKSFMNDKTLKESYLKLARKNHLHHYKKTLKRSATYISKIQEVLIKEGLPKSFLFLSMAESNFNIDAHSSTGAKGLWQFMPKTAESFKLRLDDYVDERLDFIKSTKAASKYLRYHHDRFGKWYLAILAYNSGEGRVIEAITRATIDKYLVLYPSRINDSIIQEYKSTIKEYMATKVGFYKINKIYKATRKWNIELTATDLIRIQEKIDRQYLARESRVYLRNILALSFVANKNVFQKSNIFIRKMDKSLTTVKVKGGLHLRSLSSILNMKFSDLTKINRHIKQYILPIDVKYYDVNIPYSKLKLYNRNKNKMKNNYFVIHIVKKGDTLSSIGHKYKIKYSFIRKFNELKSNRLSLKQKLVIPIEKKNKGSNKSRISKKSKKVTTTRTSTKMYKVKKGDSLLSIAIKYKVSVKDIKKANKLKSSKIRLGQELKLIIKKKTTTLKNSKSSKKSKKVTTTRTSTKMYKVKKGDSLLSIAIKYKVSVKDIKKANKLKSSKIRLGQELKLIIKKKTITSKNSKSSNKSTKSKNISTSTKMYKVKKGDSLLSIAIKYKVSVKDIKKVNKLKSSKIKLGQKLKLPIKKRVKISRKIATYKVKSGDILDRIALKYKISLKKLKKDNKLTSNVIKIGDKIEIYK